ncbi:Mur ligase family protein [Syntrophomonas palmitatica]|uniref:Mur ligase family protein n=1 Tax=Syntrophomonas palmitatica TaxID=402877 RepID=UPI000AFB05B8|nr:Mur ligase family protein [Syntrophomonas palmitatica]
MQEGIIATEVSSFQLETIKNFHPHISGILNITPDHLDRHHNMETYIENKAKILQNQNENDFAILNYEDPVIRNFKAQCRAAVIYFSTDRVLEEGIFVENNLIKAVMPQGSWEICTLQELSLRGKHNLQNILCAVAMALAAGIPSQDIAHTLRTFPGVRHRMEEAALKNGVMYINDSKATNPDSAIKALESFNEPLILIAGGRNKVPALLNWPA